MRIKIAIFLVLCACSTSQATKFDNLNDLLNKNINVSDSLLVKGVKESLFNIDIDFGVMKELKITNFKEWMNLWENTKFKLMMEKEYNCQIPYFRNI
jgi:hypothetical protein